MKKRFRRVLVVTKPSLIELEGETISERLRARLLRRDIENRQSIHDVFHALGRRRVAFELVGRMGLRSAEGFDLVVVVGGDGTFLAASHAVTDQPVLCVNSDPASSLALFSCCDRRTFGEAFDAAAQGRLSRVALNRMIVAVEGRPLAFPATNDVLFTHRNPASMTRYTLEVNGRREDQSSSGLWICTACGSTAGSRSAGGDILPIRSRKIGYVVREPYSFRGGYRLLRGTAKRRVAVTAESPGSAMWVDGMRAPFDVRAGGTVEFRTPGPPIVILGYRDSRRKKLFSRRAYE
jgi:NAD kinase